MRCPKCGTSIPEDQAGCNNCNEAMPTQGIPQFHNTIKFDIPGTISKSWRIFIAAPWLYMGISLIFAGLFLLINLPDYFVTFLEKTVIYDHDKIRTIIFPMKLLSITLNIMFTQHIISLALHMIMQQIRTSSCSFTTAFSTVFQKFRQLLLLNLLFVPFYVIILIIIILPVIFVYGTESFRNLIETSTYNILFIVITMICEPIALISLAYFIGRMCLINLMIIDFDYNIFQAIKTSGHSFKKNILPLFVFEIMLLLIIMAGIFVCFIGVIPALAIALVAQVCLYEQLRIS